MHDETWQRVRELLIDREYARRIAAGTIDKGRLRDLIGGDVDRMAADPRHGETWKQQQIDRELGEVKRPGKVATCPHCGITFNPNPAPPAELPAIAAPLWPRWTNGDKIVAVPPEHEAAYERLGYRPALADELPLAEQPIVADTPTRGPDGLLYCRPSCADREPLVTLDARADQATRDAIDGVVDEAPDQLDDDEPDDDWLDDDDQLEPDA